MSHHRTEEHLSAERVQAFLDGRLSSSDRRRAEEHLASCAGCSSEVGLWRSLFEELEDLPVLAPSRGFSDRVLQGVAVQEPVPFAARVRSALSALTAMGARHPAQDRVQDYVDGLLSPRHAARVVAHLEGCDRCAGEASEHRALVARLDGIGRFDPSPEFADRVMEGVRVEAPVTVAPKVPEWRRAIAAASRLVPQTRQAWAALSGVAVTPLATMGLLVWTLATHPTLTPGALAAFAWWKASELAGVAWQAVASTVVESSGLFEVYSFVGSLVSSPALLVLAFVAMSVGTVSAAWILYRNLVMTPPPDGRYAHASIS